MPVLIFMVLLIKTSIVKNNIVYTVYTMYNRCVKGDWAMATKAINLKLDEKRIFDIKQVASVFHMTMTDVVNEALDAYLPAMKDDPFYKLTANVQEASKVESEEILAEIDALSDDDLEIVATEHVTI